VAEDFNIVFVIGAGAGDDIGMPTGTKLVEAIRLLLTFVPNDHGGGRFKGGEHVLSSIHGFIGDADQRTWTEWNYAANHIFRNISLSRSIDNFIDSHQADPIVTKIAKLAIVATIQDFESKSRIITRPPSGIEFDPWPVAGSWLTSLWHLLSTNCNFPQFLERLRVVQMINFNYDGCLEYFLLSAARHFYRLDDFQVREVEKAIHVIHPYGGLWREGDWFGGFGTRSRRIVTEADVDRIFTFTEGARDPVTHSRLKKVLRGANLVVFLGFAFHPINLRLMFDGLQIERTPPRSREVLGTAYGISQSDKEIIETTLKKVFKTKSIKLADLKCRQLFEQYDRTLFDRL